MRCSNHGHRLSLAAGSCLVRSAAIPDPSEISQHSGGEEAPRSTKAGAPLKGVREAEECLNEWRAASSQLIVSGMLRGIGSRVRVDVVDGDWSEGVGEWGRRRRPQGGNLGDAW